MTMKRWKCATIPGMIFLRNWCSEGGLCGVTSVMRN
jgi:hypothetical protein